MEQLNLGGDLAYIEWPIKILDNVERVTHSKVIKMCKVQWSHHTEDEATWDHEEELRADYLEFFPSASKSHGEIPFKGDRSITPTFHIIKLCQAISALGCIFGKLSQGKDFSQLKLT
jgi:hypothetical protein